MEINRVPTFGKGEIGFISSNLNIISQLVGYQKYMFSIIKYDGMIFILLKMQQDNSMANTSSSSWDEYSSPFFQQNSNDDEETNNSLQVVPSHEQQQQQQHHHSPSSDLIKILKVNQLDSDRLDLEIENYLMSYFKRVFKHFRICELFEPEIMLLIRIFIYKYSIYDNDQTFGDRIQNLKYSKNQSQPSLISKYIYAFASIGIPYLYERTCKSELLNIDYSNFKKFEYYYKTIEFINFIIFLYEGKYKSLIDRIFNWRKVYATRFMFRQLSFDYMNTELIWNGLAETILFIAPLINFKKLLTFISRFNLFYYNYGGLFKRGSTSTSTSTSSSGSGGGGSGGGDTVVVPLLESSSDQSTNDECPYCNANPILIPFTSQDDGNCKHRFCYYCIESALLNDSSDHCVNCPICSMEITKTKRWTGWEVKHTLMM